MNAQTKEDAGAPDALTSRRDRSLTGPVPKGRMSWLVYLTTDEPLHQGRRKHLRRGGLRLCYQGRASWSQCHHTYSVYGREVQAALKVGAFEAVQVVARMLDRRLYEISLKADYPSFPKCPGGLCGVCWEQGERSAARTYTVTQERAYWNPLVRTFMLDLCERHAVQVGGVLL